MLRHLNVVECPCCSSVPVEVSIETEQNRLRIRQHVNGQRWESVTFLCGCKLEWSPNFGYTEVKVACPRYGDRDVVVAKRKRFLDALRLQIEATSDVDEPFKKLLLERLDVHRRDLESVKVTMALDRQGRLIRP